MASLVQSTSNTAVLATVSATYSVTPTQDNLLIAVVTASVGVGSIALSNAGWTTGASIAVGIAGGMVVFYKVAGTGEPTTVTSTATLATFMDIQIFEYDSIDDETPLDKTSSTADAGVGVTTLSSGASGTLTQANELAFVAIAQAGSNGGLVSWSNSYNTRQTTTHLITGDLNVNSTATTSSTGTWNTSQRAAGLILTFFGETGDTFGTKYQLKPRRPVINPDHPLTRGLVFDAPLFEYGGTVTNDIVGRMKGTVTASGATWEQNLYGTDLAFSAAASNVAYTVPTNGKLESLTKMSYEVLWLCNGLGGASVGRIFEKGSTNGYLTVFATTSTVMEVFVGFSTTAGVWTFPFTENAWYHMVVTYANASVANNPIVYLNGVPVTVTTGTAPVGTVLADDTTMNIGNNSAGTRNWAGKIAYTRAWNRILNASEAKALAANPWAIYKQPGLL